MRQVWEAASNAYEKVKKSVQEKMEAFRNRFEGTKSEMVKQVIDAQSPEDLIAAGKKLQEQGEALRIQEQEARIEDGEVSAKLSEKEGVESQMLDEATRENEVFNADREAESERLEYEKEVKAQEEADMAKQIEMDNLLAEKEAAQLAEIRTKLNGESIEPAIENNEKINEANKTLLNLFDKADFRSFYDHAASSENVLNDLDDAEQEQLAVKFYDETIGKTILNNARAYKVYGEFKGTSFAKKFAQLEDVRLKRAGYAGFTI
jgi:hypothetical protein